MAFAVACCGHAGRCQHRKPLLRPAEPYVPFGQDCHCPWESDPGFLVAELGERALNKLDAGLAAVLRNQLLRFQHPRATAHVAESMRVGKGDQFVQQYPCDPMVAGARTRGRGEEQRKRTDSGWEDGEILDPNKGKVYRAKAKLADGGRQLEVRGFIGVALFGRTQTWIREK